MATTKGWDDQKKTGFCFLEKVQDEVGWPYLAVVLLAAVIYITGHCCSLKQLHELQAIILRAIIFTRMA